MARTLDGRRKTPTVRAMDVEGVETAHFWAEGNTPWHGIVYDAVTNQEYDVRQLRFGWNVNDDWGGNHFGLTLRLAILKARAANR